MEVLWLSEGDVKSLLTMDEAISAAEKAFFDQGMGRTQMPPKSYLYFPQHEGDLRTMPAYLEGLDQAGVKIVNVHTRNPAAGLPTVMALLTLISTENGAPLAIMGAAYLTAIRTGAAGALAARLLARKNSRVMGLIGAGVQARTQLMGISRNFDIEQVLVYDTSMDRSRSLKDECKPFLDCEYQLASNPQDACQCDILVTTTPSRSPVVLEKWVQPGTHINAIGADARGKQELQSTLTKNSKIFVDDMAQAVHSGEVNVPISEGLLLPEEIFAQIGEVLVRKRPGRESEKEITIFDSTGLGIQDVATGYAVYEKAKDRGAGKKISLE
jgi:alanine dehydrogenase